MTPNEDQSAAILTAELQARHPFYFIKHGDAFVELVNGYGKGTCDGEAYSERLALRLLTAWTRLRETHANLYVGDWQTASFSGPDDKSRYAAEYKTLLGVRHGKLLHFECLLLMRETPDLLGFYRAVRDDGRRKLLLGPVAWQPAAELLRCDFLALPVMPNLIDIAAAVAAELARRDFDVLLYGAGMAGHVSVIDCWGAHPDRTYINLGSALDPLTSRGRTRKQQIAPHRAKAFLNGLGYDVVVTTAGRGNSLIKSYEAANEAARQRDGGRCENGHARGQRGCALCEDLL